MAAKRHDFAWFYWHPCNKSASPPGGTLPKGRNIHHFGCAMRQIPDHLPSMRIALYQPDIPQNTGTILRLCACLDVTAHIIEPAGFPVSDRHFRRAGMDYLDQVTILRHDSWSKFEQWRRDGGFRLVLFTTKAVGSSYLDYRYGETDILLFGRESAGVPDDVAAAADARLLIPIQPGLRSLNVAMAAAMALGEALRQVGSAGSAS